MTIYTDDEIKSSINMPPAKFPMRPNFAQREPIWQKQYLEKYQPNDSEDFILHDGPPYANGSIHIGHAINKILKDIIISFQRANGMKANYIPGWDCHGLPIELAVEKEIGKPSDTLSKAEFRKVCRKYAGKQIKDQQTSFKKLSIQGDWDKPYLTMRNATEANTLSTLRKIIEKGYLKHSMKPVHWCPQCESSLAEAEVEYQEKQTEAIDLMFPVVGNEDYRVVIHTTTPWTLFANEAVALNSNLDYHELYVTDANGNSFIVFVAAALSHDWASKVGYSIDFYNTMTGQEILDLNWTLISPMTNKHVPLVDSEHVTETMGTGFVHIAPAYGEDDMKVGLKYKLPITDVIDDSGNFIVPGFEGTPINKALSCINVSMSERSLISYIGKVEHKYPYCWRHKTPTVFRAKPQWFIPMDTLANKAIRALDDVEFYPPNQKNRLVSMLRDRPDWCISRQRTWGVPMAFYYHPETKQLHPKTIEMMIQIENAIENEGIDIWDTYPNEIDGYVKCTDILDVWFDSGVTHQTVLNGVQADIYLEGSDQHRGWFQTSLLTSVAINDRAPFKKVITHGFAVDKHGKKMSKSEGNVITPEELINQFGTDVVRLWVASTDYHSDIKVHPELMENSVEVYRRIRNTLKFLITNTSDINVLEDEILIVEIDDYVGKLAQNLKVECKELYKQYKFADIVTKVYDFCSETLGSFYFEVIKDRLYTEKKDSHERLSAQTACFYIASSLRHIIAPIMPFLADEVFQELEPLMKKFTKSVRVETQTLYLEKHWDTLLNYKKLVNAEIEKQRQLGLGSSLEAVVDLTIIKTENWMEKIAHELKYLFVVSKVNLHTTTNPYDVGIKVSRATDLKCQRCWHYHFTVKPDTNVCERCKCNMGRYQIVGDLYKRTYF